MARRKRSRRSSGWGSSMNKRNRKSIDKILQKLLQQMGDTKSALVDAAASGTTETSPPPPPPPPTDIPIFTPPPPPPPPSETTIFETGTTSPVDKPSSEVLSEVADEPAIIEQPVITPPGTTTGSQMVNIPEESLEIPPVTTTTTTTPPVTTFSPPVDKPNLGLSDIAIEDPYEMAVPEVFSPEIHDQTGTSGAQQNIDPGSLYVPPTPGPGGPTAGGPPGTPVIDPPPVEAISEESMYEVAGPSTQGGPANELIGMEPAQHEVYDPSIHLHGRRNVLNLSDKEKFWLRQLNPTDAPGTSIGAGGGFKDYITPRSGGGVGGGSEGVEDTMAENLRAAMSPLLGKNVSSFAYGGKLRNPYVHGGKMKHPYYAAGGSWEGLANQMIDFKSTPRIGLSMANKGMKMPKYDEGGATHTMPDGTVHPGATHEDYMAMMSGVNSLYMANKGMKMRNRYTQGGRF